MGRFTSNKLIGQRKVSVNGSIELLDAPAGYLGIFGSGNFKVFSSHGDFTIPANVSKIRVRVVGGGGGTNVGPSQSSPGGAGGGYAHGVFSVTPGTIYSVVVGAGGNRATTIHGGTSSFGALISATGGGGGMSVSTLPIAGQGYGGDFQATGGSTVQGGGGGAAGSQLGNGGSGLRQYGGGGGVGGSNAYGFGGASAFNHSYKNPSDIQAILAVTRGAPNIIGESATYGGTDELTNSRKLTNFNIRFPFDGFIGGGGAPNNISTPLRISKGGSGAGGGAGLGQGTFDLGRYRFGGDGGDGGGGGAISNSSTTDSSTSYSGNGGLGGGGGGGGKTPPGAPGGGIGGKGIVIVEW